MTSVFFKFDFMLKLISISLFLCAQTIFHVELEKKTLLNNQIEILIPKGFKELSEKLITAKYPGKKRPKLVFSNEATTTNIALSITEENADSSLIYQYYEALLKRYRTLQNLSISDHGIKIINKKYTGYFRFISKGSDQNIYNYQFFTDCNGKVLFGSFNCVEKEMVQWESAAFDIVHSLKVK